MTKKQITGILLIALLATVLFMNFASAPAPVSRVEIKDKQEEHIFVVPGAQFCVERTLRNKDIEKISPVIVPLFSDGATLESIDVKRVTEEAYMEDILDYGTCQRTVIERFDYAKGQCNSMGYTWNDSSCHNEASEDYSCITGHHQEQRTREVVTYGPVLGGQYKDGEDSNDDEYLVEIFRSGLPDDVKALENIGYSTSFDLEDEATIRMCFKAPEFGSDITSGRISYMTYFGSGYDYESSTWWDTDWKTRYRINISNTDTQAHDFEIIKLSISGTDCASETASTRVYYNDSGTWKNVDWEWYDGNKNALFFIANYTSISASYTEQDYYLYCNNSGASDANASVFLWRDDFEDADASDWSGSTITAQTGISKEGSYFGNVTGSYGNVYKSSASSPGSAYMVWYGRTDSLYSGSGARHEMAVGHTSQDRGFLVMWGANSNSNFMGYEGINPGYNYTTGVDYGIEAAADRWFSFKVDAMNISHANVYFNGTRSDHTVDPYYLPNVDLDILRVQPYSSDSQDIYIDYIFCGENNMTIYPTPSTITLGPEDTDQGGGGGGSSGYVIRTSSDNLILSPAGGTTEINGSLTWIDNSCETGEAVQGINDSGTLDCVSLGSGSGDITAVYSGTGTKGGGESGDVTIEFDCSEVAGSHVTCSGETFDIDDYWYDTLAELQAAVSNDFHNLGGADATDDDVESDDLEPFGCSDSEILKRLSGTWQCADDNESAGGGGGDMLKSTYDTDTDNIVDSAEDLSCTDCIGTTEIDDVYVLNSGDTITGDLNTRVVNTTILRIDNMSAMDNIASVLMINALSEWNQIASYGNMTIGGNLYPGGSNATQDFGSGGKWWKDGYIQVLHQGDVREYYKENPDYEYEIGDVVAIDLDSEYEIKPLNDVSDRVIGVVADLSRDVTEEFFDREEIYTVTYHLDTDVAIYGKFSPVKVKGTIHVGDYLVASDEPGVVTSLYDKEHPVTPSLFKKSKKKNEYNMHAKMLPTLGIAMEEYDSDEVGTIKVVLGK